MSLSRCLNIEKLITLVYENSAIWDRRNSDHANRKFVEGCWEKVAKSMNTDIVKVRKKWKYLRDQFAIELGKLPPNTSYSSVKWMYFKNLLFLKNSIKCKPICHNVGSLTNYNSAESEMFEQPSAIVQQQEPIMQSPMQPVVQSTVQPVLLWNYNTCSLPISDNSNSIAENTQSDEFERRQSEYDSSGGQQKIKSNRKKRANQNQPSSSLFDEYEENEDESKTKRKKIKLSTNEAFIQTLLNIEMQKAKYFKEKVTKKCAQEKEDEDLSFFKSILPHVHKIPASEKMSFRIRIQQLVNEYVYQSSPPPSYLINSCTSPSLLNQEISTIPSSTEIKHSDDVLETTMLSGNELYDVTNYQISTQTAEGPVETEKDAN